MKEVLVNLAYGLGYVPMLIIMAGFIICLALAVIHSAHSRRHGIKPRYGNLAVGIFGSGMLGMMLLIWFANPSETNMQSGWLKEYSNAQGWFSKNQATDTGPSFQTKYTRSSSSTVKTTSR